MAIKGITSKQRGHLISWKIFDKEQEDQLLHISVTIRPCSGAVLEMLSMPTTCSEKFHKG